MSLEKEPFRKYNLEETEKRIKITVSLNEKEQSDVEHMMQDLDVKSPAQALKIMAKAGQNAIHGTLTCDNVRYLVRVKRARASDYNDQRIGKM